MFDLKLPVLAAMACAMADPSTADATAGPQNPLFAAAYAQAQVAREACLSGNEGLCYELAAPLAETGNPVAQNLAATVLSDPETTPYDPEAAMALLMRSAAQGYDKAWFNIGDFFEEDHAGLAPNTELAIAAFQAAVDLDYEIAFERLGWQLLLGAEDIRDYPRALALIQDALNRFPDNAYFHGLMADSFYGGFGQDSDLAQALLHYDRAAELGSAYGQFSAGYQYYYGEGTEIDDPRAVALFEAAAAQDYAAAFGYLADSYYYGYAGEVDLARALDYARRGDALGDGFSSAHLGYMLAYGEGVEADPVAGRAALERGRDRGNTDAHYQLGDMAYFGVGQDVDYAQALGIYHQVLDQDPGHASANYSFGYMMMRGEGTDVDIPGAVPFIEAGVAGGNDSAVREAAVLFAHPDFVGPQSDPLRAMAHCLLATEQGFLDGLEEDHETLVACAAARDQLDAEGMAEAAEISETL